jgi:hypothetical protein
MEVPTYCISRAASGRYTANRAKRWAQPFTKRHFLQAARAMWPIIATLTFAGVAHAQGTMDFSGAQTLMGTFKNIFPLRTTRTYPREKAEVVERPADGRHK